MRIRNAFICLISFSAVSSLAQTPPALTAEQDHQRLLQLLHIEALRRGPDGNPASPNAANTDESKVIQYTLPDALTLQDGTKVSGPSLWWKKRRPELIELFDREIYGRVPNKTPSVRWEVVSSTPRTFGTVRAVENKLVGHVDNRAYPSIKVDIDMTLVVPADVKQNVPVIMEFTFPGFPGRPPLPEPLWHQLVIQQGWGYASLIPTSVQADNGAGLTQGIIGLVNKGQPRKLDDWGALRAWAWGASRALDYLATQSRVDAKHVAIEGLSRYGKAALVTMAYDPRFAVGFIGSSGAGGAKLWRRNFGEQVENVASASEYHWMAGNFLKYAGALTVNDLPVDAHELIALAAPRPLYISAGSPSIEGGWIDAKGSFDAAVAAGPVYRLLGAKPLQATSIPPIEIPLLSGDLAFRQHSGGHTTGPNWPTFIAFAQRYLEPALARDVQEVALTFDDLPAHGTLPPAGGRTKILGDIIAALQKAGAPAVYGFLNAKGIADEGADAEQAVQLWRDAHLPLGNHTLSHLDLEGHSVEEFEREITGNEPALQRLMKEEGWHQFRYPYLHEGATLDDRNSVRDFLYQHGYSIAQVTIDSQDYLYNDAYLRCVLRNDEPSVMRLKQTYLRRVAESFELAKISSQKLWNRNVRQVMLMHVGAFQAATLPSLLDQLRQDRIKLITLEQAQIDPAYANDPGAQGHSRGTFLDQMLLAKQLPLPTRNDDDLQQLGTICR
jgi:peptidoglycan/xylan/chitin deacetylase (PgdA/CDA1 family)